jgi:hypothetical protein
MDNPISWDYLTTVPGQDEVFGPFSVVFAIVFGLGFLAASFYATRPWAPPLGGRFKKRFVARSATIIAWITGIGLFFFLIRILQINPLNFGMRIWLWLSLLALVIAIGWFAVGAGNARRSAVPVVGSKASQRTVNPVVSQRRPRPVRRRRA